MTRHLATLRWYRVVRATGISSSTLPPAGFGLRALGLPAPLRVGLARSLSRLYTEPTDRFPRVTRANMDRSHADSARDQPLTQLQPACRLVSRPPLKGPSSIQLVSPSPTAVHTHSSPPPRKWRRQL